MAIVKARANHYNGGSYDTLHYETQVSQVKVLDDSGSIYGDIAEMLYKGKVVERKSLNTLIMHGGYKIKNCTNMPSGVSASKELLLIVNSVGSGSNRIIKQEIVDYDSGSTYVRIIEKGKIGKWTSGGEVVSGEISNIVKDIGSLSGLKTSAKGNTVAAINEVDTRSKTNVTNIASNKTAISLLEKNFNSHNHDGVYFKITGGSVNGSVSIKNNSELQGKLNSGNSVNLAKINSSNDARFGHSSVRSIMASKDGDFSVSDGSKLYKVFHSGNMGKGSGLDAEKVLGISGSNFARKDTSNTFQDTIVVNDGNFYMDRVKGGKSSSVIFRFEKGQTGRILATEGGELRLYGGSKIGMKVLPSGDTETTFTHTLNAKNRNVSVRFKRGDSDTGRGLHLNNTTNERFGLYDWGIGGWYFFSEKGSREVRFPDSIVVQGNRISIQSGTPSKPSNGDIWFKL